MVKKFIVIACFLISLSGISANVGAEDNIVLVQGVGFTQYDLYDAFSLLGKADIRDYPIVHGIGIGKNTFRLQRQIGRGTLRKSKLIVLANTPADAMDNWLQELIIKWVEDGGALVVLGGITTFGKGNFAGSKLATLLPVEIKGEWEVEEVTPPAALRSELLSADLFIDKGKPLPVIFYRHNLSLKRGARVLAAANNKPILVGWEKGKGRVVAFLGVPMGFTEQKDLVPFWEWKKWPEFLAGAFQWTMKKK